MTFPTPLERSFLYSTLIQELGRLPGSGEPVTALAPAAPVEPASGLEQSRSSHDAVTLILCGEPCDHDFFGPGSSEHTFEFGSERVCGKCGRGAMEIDMGGDE